MSMTKEQRTKGKGRKSSCLILDDYKKLIDLVGLGPSQSLKGSKHSVICVICRENKK